MNKLFRSVMALAALLIALTTLNAQPARQPVTILISPDRSDWQYKTGEQVTFKATVLQNDFPLDNITLNYEIKPEKMGTIKKGEITLKNGTATIPAGTLKKPGFLRCFARVTADGKQYEKYATAGFDVDQIQPTTTLPSDFTEFWDKWKNELAKIPVSPVLTLMPELCTDKVDVFHVSMKNIDGKIYGILCKPKKEGKYPAILHVPGAGVRPYFGDISNAEAGIITLQIGIHGIPVNLPIGVYDDLRTGALKNYNRALMDNKDDYYYKRVYLGCVRAIDFIYELPEFDGQNIAVTGGSQGGALSIITAGLDPRIKWLAAFYPALSDLTGYLDSRAGGWPHMFIGDEGKLTDRIETSKYYDVVNFARFVKVEGWYSWGFNDNVCPPTSIFAAYNVIPAKKEKHIFRDTQHWTYPEQREALTKWLQQRLLK
ncbi:MAG: acetylxylan esterase [Prolixibacteraceae bacterium]|jgi:cephalosporin-C deacetylase-like acetyl esterase|nr:acetylxylan esterase [Prolixibacteraceae bacterium]